MAGSFFKILDYHFDVKLNPKKPDYLIYSCFGSKFRKYHCPRIFYTGENMRPDPAECDFSFSFDPTEGNNFRLPIYALNLLNELQRPRDISLNLALKNKFCNFIYGDPSCFERNLFYILLSKYKRVDALGQIFNNTHGLLDRRDNDYRTKINKFPAIHSLPDEVPALIRGYEAEKISALRSYKFTIAFENSSYPGYTTEKIAHAFIAGSVPIYWGNSEITREFNPDAFINCHDFNDFNEVIRHIIKVDNDDAYYRQYLEAAPLANNEYVTTLLERTITRFRNIFDSDTPSPVYASPYGRLLYFTPHFITKRIVRNRRQSKKRRKGKLSRACSNAYKRGDLETYIKSLASSKTGIDKG